jgi:selenium metabolism protein YedF
MACPQPVITVKRALENHQGDSFTILLDTGAPHENVLRFLNNRGISATESVTGNEISLGVSGSEGARTSQLPDTHRGRLILITSDQFGDGPVELGRLLMKNFIIALLEQAEVPDRMLFMNTGIQLTTEGSEVLPALERLANNGVEILSCGLCLDYFQKKELLRVGSVTNMFTTVESLLQTDSVIKL